MEYELTAERLEQIYVYNYFQSKSSQKMSQNRNSHQNVKTIRQYSYSLNDCIGKGNFSNVYKGIDTKKNQTVAIKIVQLDKLQSSHLQSFISQEVNILKKVSHPNIIKFYQAIIKDRTYYIITQLCKEGNLQERVKNKKGLTFEQLTEVIGDVYQGLKYLRQIGVCHRDIKAANIFMKGKRAKIADFGLSKFYKQGFKDMDVGSPLFMSPEGTIYNTYGQKTDIWAFGILIFELIHGVSPFIDCKTNSALKKAISSPIPQYKFNSGIKKELRQLINILLTIDEHKRPSVYELEKNVFIKSCIAKTLNKKASGLNIVQRSRILSYRVKSETEGNKQGPSLKQLKQQGKIQLMGDFQRKKIELGGVTHRPLNNPQISSFKSQQMPSNQAVFAKPPPKPIQQPQTNRDSGQKKEVSKLLVPQTTRNMDELRYRINSTKTIETKESQEDFLHRKRDNQFYPFFRK